MPSDSTFVVFLLRGADEGDVLQCYLTEGVRVAETLIRLACVVLAEGDMDELRTAVMKAKSDYRDVLAPRQLEYGTHWQKHI